MFHMVVVCARICNHHPLADCRVPCADCRVRQFSHGQFKALSLLLSLIMVISQLELLANSINNISATGIYFQMRKHLRTYPRKYNCHDPHITAIIHNITSLIHNFNFHSVVVSELLVHHGLLYIFIF